MGLVIYITCGGHDHRLELSPDGSLTPLDHNTDMLSAFTAFGAAAPACARQIEEWDAWRDTDEARNLLDQVLHAVVNHSTKSTGYALQRDLASLALEYADRAVDSAMSLEDYDLEEMPADLLATISSFLVGDATRDDVLGETQKARKAITTYEWTEIYDFFGSSLWKCVVFAAEAAMLENVTRCVDATILTADAAREIVSNVAGELGNDYEEVDAEETMWQLRRAVEVLEAHGGRL
jgi:hypothetical protein